VLPHLLVGIGEGVLTLLVVRFAQGRGWFPEP